MSPDAGWRLERFVDNERAGGRPVSEPAGSAGGRNAAVTCSGHYCTRLPSDNAGK